MILARVFSGSANKGLGENRYSSNDDELLTGCSWKIRNCPFVALFKFQIHLHLMKRRWIFPLINLLEKIKSDFMPQLIYCVFSDHII